MDKKDEGTERRLKKMSLTMENLYAVPKIISGNIEIPENKIDEKITARKLKLMSLKLRAEKRAEKYDKTPSEEFHKRTKENYETVGLSQFSTIK